MLPRWILNLLVLVKRLARVYQSTAIAEPNLGVGLNADRHSSCLHLVQKRVKCRQRTECRHKYDSKLIRELLDVKAKIYRIIFPFIRVIILINSGLSADKNTIRSQSENSLLFK